tara:strand:- start:440 stop:2221 length:1782 start_codon:yes stop_codon:yes gene_type:complete
MAELGIPLLALGGLYIASKKREEKRENFTSSLPNTNIQDKNYPSEIVQNAENDLTSKLSTVNKYDGQQAYTDKYFNQQFNDNMRESYSFMDSSSRTNQTYTSLTGEQVEKDYFKHNNMVPFFGGSVKSKNIEPESNESILDNMIGNGSGYIKKEEQAPLFKPDENYQHAYGTPNNTDFMRSRVNPSSRFANVKPFADEKVGPGLNLGYTSGGSGGFNSGLMQRELWNAKTVDELRAKTNQKSSGHLAFGYEGPANSGIKNMGTLGKQEKNRPERDFEMTQDRLFTTTGAEKGATLRSETIHRNVSRPETSIEYSGNAAYGNSSIYIDGQHSEPHRNQLEAFPLGTAGASGKGIITENDHGILSKKAYPNNRTQNAQKGYFGNMAGSLSAAVAPILDVLKPSRKENVIGNMRPYQNAKSTVSNSYLYDPSDKPAPTIRETTEKGKMHLNVNMNQRGAYAITENQVAHNQRASQSDYMYIGGSSAPGNLQDMRSYEAEYNQRNNDIKSSTIKGRLSQGNMNLYSGSIAQKSKHKDNYLVNKREVAPSVRGSVPSVEHMGYTHSAQPLSQNIQMERNTPDILNALQGNPYAIPYKR